MIAPFVVFVMSKLLVSVQARSLFVAQALEVKTPKVVVPPLVVPILML